MRKNRELWPSLECFEAIIFVTQNFTRSALNWSVSRRATLRGLLASWTLVIPQHCLINNCLIYSRSSLSLSFLLFLKLYFSFLHTALFAILFYSHQIIFSRFIIAAFFPLLSVNHISSAIFNSNFNLSFLIIRFLLFWTERKLNKIKNRKI